MSGPLRVVHYVNQFFGGIGGEEQADVGVSRARPAPSGPGRALEAALGDGARIEATIICGDNFASERADDAARAIARRARPAEARRAGRRPGVRLGPLRPGLRAGLPRRAASGASPRSRPCIPDNPGASSARREVYIVPTGAVDDVHAGRARRRWRRWRGASARGEPLGPAEVEGYIAAAACAACTTAAARATSARSTCCSTSCTAGPSGRRCRTPRPSA